VKEALRTDSASPLFAGMVYERYGLDPLTTHWPSALGAVTPQALTVRSRSIPKGPPVGRVLVSVAITA